jgi:DNA gyrase subunit A
MRLKEGDELIDMSMLLEGQQVLAITTNGYGKRTDPDQYREQGRNGMGIRAMNLTDKTGELAAHLAVNTDEDILLITDDGTVIRMAVADIRESGRSTQGVRRMRIAEGAKIVSVARAEQEQEEEETGLPVELIDGEVTAGSDLDYDTEGEALAGEADETAEDSSDI